MPYRVRGTASPQPITTCVQHNPTIDDAFELDADDIRVNASWIPAGDLPGALFEIRINEGPWTNILDEGPAINGADLDIPIPDLIGNDDEVRVRVTLNNLPNGCPDQTSEEIGPIIWVRA